MAKLNAGEIKYLAFEGGGGKGIAFLGALQVLTEQKILANNKSGYPGHIEGYAGASAGAITAFLLSIGYDFYEVEEFLNPQVTDFNTFWEGPLDRKSRLCPKANDDYETRPNSADEITFAQKLGYLKAILPLLLVSQVELSPKLKAVLQNSLPEMLAHLNRDMGLFPGNEPRNVFMRVLEAKVRVKGGAARVNKGFLTFKEHNALFNKWLVLTGTNLSTGRTEVFSATATPNFPVVDAVRISMSLPFIFKPYVIKEEKGGWPPGGTYVDGGLWNNAPFREFVGEGLAALFTPRSDPRSSGTPPPSAPPGLPAEDSTLLLRLEINPAGKVEDLWTLLKVTAKNGVFGCGESQVNRRYSEKAIILDTEGLSLVDFSPPPDVKKKVVKRARRTTNRYFGVTKPEDADKSDDDASDARRNTSNKVY